MPTASLVDTCIKSCIKNIRSLYDVGSFEYWKIKIVLQRIESPEQLHEIEENSPQIKGEDAELWKAFIARDIPNWRTKNYQPKNPLKWYEVYRKYKKEQQEEIKRDEEILRNTMMGLSSQNATHVTKLVPLKTLPKVPRDPRMIANNGGVPLKGKTGFKKQGASALLFNAGSKTKITDGKSVLTKARREAKEISAMGKLARPTHQLTGRLGQVKKAPAGMATEYKIANQPAVKILSRKHRLPTGQFEGGITGPSLEEREKRLRAMQSRATGASTGSSKQETLVGSSDDDAVGDLFDDDEEDEEDDEPRYTAPAPRSNNNSSSSSRPLSRPQQASSSPPARPAYRAPARQSDMSKRPGAPSSASDSRNASPAPGGIAKPMMKRRAEVDVFNRNAKKPRR